MKLYHLGTVCLLFLSFTLGSIISPHNALTGEEIEPFNSPSKESSQVDIQGLASTGKTLDLLSLNEAMIRMGGDVAVIEKAFLLDENEAIIRGSYRELVDYIFGFGLTELSRTLLFRCDGWKTDFDRHVYAARLYGRKWCPLDEWRPLDEWCDQGGLNWRINFQAIFKADNQVLLYDILLHPDKVFQKDKSLFGTVRPSTYTVDFIKRYLNRLIIHYDSARILKALQSEEFAELARLLGFQTSKDGDNCYSIKEILQTDADAQNIVHDSWKLCTLLDVEHHEHYDYDRIEFVIENGYWPQLKNAILQAITKDDLFWAMQMLYDKDLLGTHDEDRIIESAIRQGSFKVLNWIYNRAKERQQPLRVDFASLITTGRINNRFEILQLHSSYFPDYKPSQDVVNSLPPRAEVLGFLESFTPPLYPSQNVVLRTYNPDLSLRVYKAHPDWIPGENELRLAIRGNDPMKNNYSAFIEYATQKRSTGILMSVDDYQLLQYNATIDKSYIPKIDELYTALDKDPVKVLKWLEGEDRFKGLFESCINRVQAVKVKGPELVQYFCERGIGPTLDDLKVLAQTGDVAVLDWILQNYRDEIRKLSKSKIYIQRVEGIKWWIENIDNDYIPATVELIKDFSEKKDPDGARYLFENFTLDHTNKQLKRMLDKYHSKVPEKALVDFLELMLEQPELITMIRKRLGGECESYRLARGRLNLNRILTEHETRPISMDELEFILNLPNLQDINIKVLNRLIQNKETKILELLSNYGVIQEYDEHYNVLELTRSLQQMAIS